MPWNQPGSGGGKDPWGQNKGQQQGPPDLDEIVKNIQNKIGGLFGGRGGGNGAGRSGGRQMPSKFGISIILLIAIVVWMLTGFYTVDQGEQAIVLRFGKYLETNGAGLRWNFPAPIEDPNIINVQKVNTVEVGYRESTQAGRKSKVTQEALMLTADENIIDIEFAVQFDIKDPIKLLFKVAENAHLVVRGATESAVREVVGRNTMDFAITEGRAEIAQQTKILLQEILDRYETGINIRAVEMQNAQPPAEVKSAFDDAVKAREDEERIKNEAEAYSNDVIPRARGRAARVIQEAEAYKASVIARSEGEASRFDQVLTEYRKAPDITRDRLYLESMEQVLGQSSKLLIDQKGGNNVIYLPLDQLIRQQRSSPSASLQESSGDNLSANTGETPNDSVPRRSGSSIRSRR